MRLLLAGAFVLGSLLVFTPHAIAETHEIQVRDFEFSPSEITIVKGDVVRWIWESGIHTTTNGTGAADENAGTLWDANITGSSQTFEFTFAAEGTFPFFCRPHELAGMKGTITVTEGTGVDATSWGRIKTIFDRPRPGSRTNP